MKITLQQVLIVLTTVAMITVNALANILPFNNLTTGEISDQFQTFFVPAGYVFSIWGLIYLLLLVFSFGYAKALPKGKSYLSEIFPLYLFSSLLNAVWIVLWHYGYFLTTGVVIVSLLVTLAMIYAVLKKQTIDSLAEKLVIHLPFWVYLGWVSVATIANISNVLWLLNWNGLGITGPIWASVMMIVAGLLAGFITLKSRDFAFALVVIWAIVGIVIKFSAQSVMLYTGIVVIALLTILWLYRRYVEFSAKGQV